jgi:FAD/FMN-containing dehydrogenase
MAVTTDPDIRATFEADASGLRMMPDAVARPTSADDVVAVLAEAVAARQPVTTAGAQSSTTGASITERGVLLSMRGCERILDIDPATRTARVEAGALVGDVKRAAAAYGLTWAPDPTSEVESTVGGAIACNASGPRSLWYGPTRRHVRALRVALADGRVLALRRPEIDKNTAGYVIAHDPVDWFIGSEGTLGVVLEAELALVPLPEHVVGLTVPFATERAALAFVVSAREARTVSPRCIEYLDARAVVIARAACGELHSVGDGAGVVYVEQALSDSPAPDAALDEWLAMAEAHEARADDIQVFDGDAAIARARVMRHAVPATMNERGARARAAGGRKVSTDWAVPYRHLATAVTAARTIAERGGKDIEPAVTYGHVGNGHPHQNYIARDAAELTVIEQVVEDTLRYVLGLGGTIAAEHGIGKLKRRWLELQLSPLQLALMRAVKRELDPLGLLAPGNIF